MFVRHECFKCNKNLHGHPKIKVEGNIYCYFCAKKVVAILDSSTEEKHAKEVRAYEVQYEKWKSWDDKRELALPSTNTQMWITLGVAIGCAVILTNPIFFLLPGLIVGFIVNHFYFQNQKNDSIKPFLSLRRAPAGLVHFRINPPVLFRLMQRFFVSPAISR